MVQFPALYIELDKYFDNFALCSAMSKQTCTCCSRLISESTEWCHLQRKGPKILAMQVLVKNPYVLVKKPKTKLKHTTKPKCTTKPSAKKILHHNSTRPTNSPKCSKSPKHSQNHPAVAPPFFVPGNQDIMMDLSTTEVFSAFNNEESEAHILLVPQCSSWIAAKTFEFQKHCWETGHQKLTQEDEDIPDEAEGDEHT